MYGFSSLLKQKIKTKNKKKLLRHLHRRNFFLKKIYVMKCSKKRNYARSITTSDQVYIVGLLCSLVGLFCLYIAGLVSAGGSDQAQRYLPASLPSESGESFRHCTRTRTCNFVLKRL